uniref:Uncharacterized protein n=1 Tax=Myotis myotis TaxID=51298 RepID=A0A7J7UQ34_MYOMY|nr:hypothetical protein mMyoMyo1_008679 [Myotis myotis]
MERLGRCSHFLAESGGRMIWGTPGYLHILPGMAFEVLSNLSLPTIRGPAFQHFTHGTLHVSLAALFSSCYPLSWWLFWACLLWTACLIEGKSSAFLIIGSPALSSGPGRQSCLKGNCWLRG